MIARGYNYPARSDQLDESTLAATLSAFLMGDRHDANAVLSNDFADPCDQIEDMLNDVRLASIISAIAERLGLEADTIEQMCRDALEAKLDSEKYGEPLAYLRPWDKIEIAILPALSLGLSVEDERIESWSHGQLHPTTVIPNYAFTQALRLINMSSARYMREVRTRYGVDLKRAAGHADQRPVNNDHRERAKLWQRLHVRHHPSQPVLMTFDELFEVLENASLGGQFAVAAKAPVGELIAADWTNGVELRGTVQIDIVDYLWGSGHTVSHRGGIVLRDRERLHIARDVGHRFDDVCGFTCEYFSIHEVHPAGSRSHRRAPPSIERIA